MKRELWAMSDNEIWSLLQRAHMVLDELNLTHHGQIDQVELIRARLTVLKRKSPEWHKADNWLYAATKSLDAIEQRIAAQRTYVQALENESYRRNPPFWSRDDLDRINRQR